eukprot:5782520-Amphidinium_carterae.2
MEAEVTHEPATNAAVEAIATEEPSEYLELAASMQKELDAFQAYDCMEEYDESEALTQVAAREILPMLAVTTKKPVEGSKTKKKKVGAVWELSGSGSQHQRLQPGSRVGRGSPLGSDGQWECST